jgi:hypothetical protein
MNKKINKLIINISKILKRTSLPFESESTNQPKKDNNIEIIKMIIKFDKCFTVFILNH